MTAEAVRESPRDDRPGFTLVELLTVLGLVALLLSLLLPVVGKVRAAADATSCLSNLRQMGAAWMMYTADSRGRLMRFDQTVPDEATQPWDLYWPGVLEAGHVRGAALLCAAASEPSENEQNVGCGNATRAWTGRFAAVGSVVRLNDTTYRESSYGYNRYLTAGGGFVPDVKAKSITSARFLSDLPVFMDCAVSDVRPVNANPRFPAESPPNLRGDQITIFAPEHWAFLLARHGRGVNVCMADGSARWVGLEETYGLRWRSDWVPYRLTLPAR